MSDNPYFPTVITDEERQAGFIVITDKLTPSDAGARIAVSSVAKSVRLLKMQGLNGVPEYMLQMYGFYKFSGAMHPTSNSWHGVWNSPCNRLAEVVKRMPDEELLRDLIIVDPPENSENA